MALCIYLFDSIEIDNKHNTWILVEWMPVHNCQLMFMAYLYETCIICTSWLFVSFLCMFDALCQCYTGLHCYIKVKSNSVMSFYIYIFVWMQVFYAIFCLKDSFAFCSISPNFSISFHLYDSI